MCESIAGKGEGEGFLSSSAVSDDSKKPECDVNTVSLLFQKSFP